jgi:hypothetical protein
MKPLFKVPVIYGAIAGAFGVLIVVALYYMGIHPFLIPVYKDYRILLLGIFIFFSLREFRDVYQNGIMSFWEGIIVSFILVSTFAIIAGAGVGVFAGFVPEFIQKYISLHMDILKNFPADEIEKIGGQKVIDSNLRSLPATDVRKLVELYIWQSFVIGALISIILSLILRKQPKP